MPFPEPSPAPAEQLRFVLIANLRYAQFPDAIRCNCSALLLERDELGEEPRFVMRGFGPDPAWPVFDFPLKRDISTYYLEGARSLMGTELLRTDGTIRPISSGAYLHIGSSTRLCALHAEDSERPLAIVRWALAESKQDDIVKVWQRLVRLADSYYSDHVYRPYLRWGPPGAPTLGDY